MSGHDNYNNNKCYLLVELLKEDQEPFNLNNYISDDRRRRRRRRNIQLNNNRPPPPPSDHHPKHDHVGSIYKLSDFLYSPSTTTRTGSVFLNSNPASAPLLSKTSILRIKRRDDAQPRKQMKYIGVGTSLFSSLLKKLKDGDQSKKMDQFLVEEGGGAEESSRRSSPSRKSFGWSPFSPFRFSSGRRSPVSSSSSSPINVSPPSRRQRRQKKENHGCNKKEEKEETNSPVSVLDRLSFENEDDDVEDHPAHYKSRFPNLHSAKEEELLNKLRRFEKHVNLDPIELEKTVVQQLYNYHNETEGSPDNINQQTYEYELLEENGDKMEYYCLGEEKEEVSSTNNIDHMIDQMVLMINDQLMKNQWTRYDQEEEREETGMLIEVSIFDLLVEELAVDLIQL